MIVGQHVFPDVGIGRFAENRGIDLFDMARKGRRRARPREAKLIATLNPTHVAKADLKSESCVRCRWRNELRCRLVEALRGRGTRSQIALRVASLIDLISFSGGR